MSKVQMLRAFVNQRLTAAADEIFEVFERTIAEYEEELYRSTENHRQRKLLDDVFNHEVRSHRADVQQLLVVEEMVPPEQQEWSSSLDQEDPEPPHIKEEQEELCTSQEGEQLEEADIKFLFASVPAKSEEDDEDEAQSSQLHESQTEENREEEHLKSETDGEDCAGPEPARNSDPDSPLQPATHDETSHSEPETDYSRDWGETEEPQSGLNPLQNNEGPVSVMDTAILTGEKQFSCSVCSKRFSRKCTLVIHMRLHSEGKCFSCSVCKTGFITSARLRRHMRIHTRYSLKDKLTVQTEEKSLSCSVCSKIFTKFSNLRRHLLVHTGEKRFSCSVCDKRFTRLDNVKRHKCVGESSRKNEAAEMLVESFFQQD